MQIRNISFLFFFTIVFVVVVGALVAKSKADDRHAILVVTQETPLQDGATLINSRYARCHTVELIKQTTQTHAEWENTLAQMEKIGVTLSNDEKTVLIDYLTGVDTP